MAQIPGIKSKQKSFFDTSDEDEEDIDQMALADNVGGGQTGNPSLSAPGAQEGKKYLSNGKPSIESDADTGSVKAGATLADLLDMGKLDERYKKLEDEKVVRAGKEKEDEERTNKAELFETIGRGLNRIAAGVSGQKSGADLSQVGNTPGTDWEAVRKRISDRYGKDSEISAKERESLLGTMARLQKEAKPKDQKLTFAKGVVQKGTKLPAYLSDSSPTGYMDATGKPVNVDAWSPEERNFAPQVNEKEDGNLLTLDDKPVYRLTSTDKKTGITTTKLRDMAGHEIDPSQIKTKTGIDPKSILSEKQVQSLADADSMNDLIADIRETKKEIPTGRIEETRNRAAGFINADDPKVSAFRAKVTSQLNEYIHKMTGAALGNKEAERLKSTLPTMADSDETFNSKLDDFERRFKIEVENYKKRLKQQGKRFDDESSSTPTVSKDEKPNTRKTVNNADELP